MERDIMSCCFARKREEREVGLKPGETDEIVKVLAASWG